MADGQRAAVLIVDDEPLNRDLLRRVLQREYEVIEAEDAAAAVAALEDRGGDLAVVVCDQLMPGRNGTELAGDVRDRWPQVKFLLLTGYDDDPDVKRAKASGLVTDVVTKPWRGSALKQLISDVLAG